MRQEHVCDASNQAWLSQFIVHHWNHLCLASQFTPGSLITRLARLPVALARSCPCSREYTPALSAERHRPEAHCLSCSILPPAVTATGTIFWADR